MKSKLHRAPQTSTTKCVQLVGQGIPARFSNDDAHRLVAVDKDGQYCPKHVFKKYRAAHPEHPARSRITKEGRIVADV